MNLEEIARHQKRISAERDAAMYGTPPGADDDLDGDRERDTEPAARPADVCDCCEGAGIVSVSWSRGVKCWYCNGTGKA